MCWIGSTDSKTIADKDIKVIKIMSLEHGQISSYYRETQWKIGETKHSAINLVTFNNTSFINEALHSYDANSKLIPNHFLNELKILGFSFILLDSYYISESLCIAACTIPEGAVYYKNSYGEFVSNKLRLDKILVNGKDEIIKFIKDKDLL